VSKASETPNGGRGRGGAGEKSGARASGNDEDKPSPAGRAPRRRDREKTIARILDAAEKLLEEKGPDGFGLAELGREADVSFGLIHHYFGGKAGLLKLVLQRTLRDMGQEIRSLQDDGSFWKRDAPAVLVVFDTFMRRPGFARLGAWGLLTGLITADDVANEFRADREALEAMIEEFRKEAPEPSRENVAAITTLLWSAVLGFSLLRPLLTSTFDWNEESDTRVREQLARAVVGLTRSS
jgi:AcrR family transcriptional regulator